MTGEVATGLISALLNLGLYAIQLGLYFWEGRRRSQQNKEPLFAPFAYYTGNVGDTVGLTVISIGVGNAFFDDLRFQSWMTLAPAFGLAVCWGYFRYSRYVAINDWSFTAGALTHAGQFHLVYIFFGASVAVSGIGFLASGDFGPYLLAAIVGGAVYLLAFVFDLRAGHHRWPGSRTESSSAN